VSSVLLLAFLSFASVAAAQSEVELNDGTSGADKKEIIASGITVAGLDLSGLTVYQAYQKFEGSFAFKKLQRGVTVKVAGSTFSASAKQLGFQIYAYKTVRRAYNQGLKNNKLPAGSNKIKKEVAVASSYSKSAVKRFSSKVSKRIYRSPRNATVKVRVTKMVRKRERYGRSVSTGTVAKAVRGALNNPETRSRRISIKVNKLKPRVTTNSLGSQYPTVITVDRSTFKLRLFKRLKWKKTYKVAVGKAGTATPAGTYHITNKQVNPSWTPPNSSWVPPSLRGKTVPGGAPGNPLRHRWMGLAGGVGIHGTVSEDSIGSAASHGCIRMRKDDVIDLYNRAPIGTLVLIK